MKKKIYTVDFSRHGNGKDPPQTFEGLAAIRRWLMDGLMGTEGAERDHFSDMLIQLETGHTTLYY